MVAMTAIASLFAFMGCSAEVNVGGSSSAPGDELAEEIQKAYSAKTGIGLSRLTCESVDADVGETFGCSGRNARSIQVEITGKVTDSTGDGIEYNWSVVRAIAPGVFYERGLRSSIEDHGVPLSEVRCPAEVNVKVGTRLRCTATDRDGVAKGVTLRLTDLDGGFDYTVEGEAPVERSTTS